MRLLLALLLAGPVAAQPSAEAVLDAWRTDWRRAADGVQRVVADESAAWTVDGPRGTVEVVADGVMTWGGDRPEREVLRLVVNGEPVDPRRADRAGDRWRRAFGPPGREVLRPPDLPIGALADAEPLGIEPDEIGGVPAWRVAFRGGRTAWFTRWAASPRLLRARVERRPPRGRFVSEVRYARVRGLDVPVEVETRLTVRQRRRLRDYFVTLTARSDFSRHVLR